MDGGGGGNDSGGDDVNDKPVQVAQAQSGRGGGGMRGAPNAPIETLLLFYRPLAAQRRGEVQALDPIWRAPQSLTSTNPSPEAELAHLRSTIFAAEARLAELGRPVANSLPGGRLGIGGNGGPPLEGSAPSGTTGAPRLPEFGTPMVPSVPMGSLPDFLTPKPKAGTIAGNLADLKPGELSGVRLLADLGNDIEIIPTGVNRSADFKVNGVPHEWKTVSEVEDVSSDGLSAAISSRIMTGRGQAADIIVDAHSQPGMTREIAE